MTSTNQIFLTPSLEEGATDRAVRVLQTYFASGSAGFTGGRFDSFDPSATKASSADVFTADDVAALTLLSVDLKGRAVLELLDSQRSRFSELLAAIGPDRDLVEADSTSAEVFPAHHLWLALRELPQVGPTIASKLMARKRPRLVPIFDSVINQHLLHGSGVLWEPLRLSLRADGQKLHHRLLDIRGAAGLGDHISAIRVLDVLAWMDGRGHAQKILDQVPLDPAAEEERDVLEARVNPAS